MGLTDKELRMATDKIPILQRLQLRPAAQIQLLKVRTALAHPLTHPPQCMHCPEGMKVSPLHHLTVYLNPHTQVARREAQNMIPTRPHNPPLANWSQHMLLETMDGRAHKSTRIANVMTLVVLHVLASSRTLAHKAE